MKKFLAILVCLISLSLFSQQKPAFWDDIQHFKKLNKEIHQKQVPYYLSEAPLSQCGTM